VETKEIKKRFWALVRERFNKSIREDAEMKTSMRNLYFAVFWALLFFALYISKKIPTDIFENAIFNLGFEILLIAGPLIYAFFSLLYVSYTEIPAILYSEQGGFIENPFEVEIYKPNRKPDRNRENVRVSLKITNKMPNKQIHDCYIRLDEVFNVKTKLHKQDHDFNNLMWNAREQNQVQPLPISATAYRLCDVAMSPASTNNAHFLTWVSEKTKEYIEPGEYVLNYKIFGSWGGFSKSYDYHSTIIVEHNYEVNIKDDVREGKYAAEHSVHLTSGIRRDL